MGVTIDGILYEIALGGEKDFAAAAGRPALPQGTVGTLLCVSSCEFGVACLRFVCSRLSTLQAMLCFRFVCWHCLSVLCVQGGIELCKCIITKLQFIHI